jgi:ketosteroid isomerase-like protein
MTEAEMDELLDRHFRAEERADIEGTVGDLAEDVEHELAGHHRGSTRDDARAFYRGLFGQLRLKHINSKRRLYGPDFVVDEAIVEAETTSGQPAPFRLLHIFQFRDGRISRESAWRAPLDGE